MRKSARRRPQIRPYGPAPLLEVHQVRALEESLKSVKRPWVRLFRLALLHTGLGTGMRCGEILHLTIGDVVHRFEPDGTPVIRSKIGLSHRITKSRRSRIVDITPQAQKHLANWVKYLVSERKFGDKNFLFFVRRNPREPLTIAAAHSMFRAWGRRAGLERLSTHSMRRTHATFLMRLGADMKIIKEQLGHSSLAYTDIYLSVDPAEKQRQVARLEF